VPRPTYGRPRRRTAVEPPSDRFQREIGSVMGLYGLLVEAVWSNRTCQAFCLGCRSAAPAPVVELALDGETRCAACGKRLCEAV
jgi:hypothetical protein